MTHRRGKSRKAPSAQFTDRRPELEACPQLASESIRRSEYRAREVASAQKTRHEITNATDRPSLKRYNARQRRQRRITVSRVTTDKHIQIRTRRCSLRRPSIGALRVDVSREPSIRSYTNSRITGGSTMGRVGGETGWLTSSA